MPDIWERQPGETDAAYEAFRAFLQSPLPRSVMATARTLAERKARANPRKATKSPPASPSGAIKGWSRRFRWDERAQAHDSWLEAKERAATVKAVEEVAADRVNRQAQVNEKAWEVSTKLIAKGLELLDQVASTDPRSVVALIRTGDELARLATGLPPKGAGSAQADQASQSQAEPQPMPAVVAEQLRKSVAQLGCELLGLPDARPAEED